MTHKPESAPPPPALPAHPLPTEGGARLRFDGALRVDPATAEAPAPGQHPHVLPGTGGCFVLVDGVLLPDPAAATDAPTSDPEV